MGQDWAIPMPVGPDEAMPAAGSGRGVVAGSGGWWWQGGGSTLALCPQPASATRRAPAAASARRREDSASASPTSSAGAATTAPRAATALGPWAAAVSSAICPCHLSVHPAFRAPFAAHLPVHLSVCPSVRACVHLSPAVLQPVGWEPVSPLSICLSIHLSIHPLVCLSSQPCASAGSSHCLALTHLSVHPSLCPPVCPQESSCVIACGLDMPWVLLPYLSVCPCIPAPTCLTRAMPSHSLRLLPGGLRVTAVRRSERAVPVPARCCGPAV